MQGGRRISFINSGNVFTQKLNSSAAIRIGRKFLLLSYRSPPRPALPERISYSPTVCIIAFERGGKKIGIVTREASLVKQCFRVLIIFNFNVAFGYMRLLKVRSP